MLRQSRDGYRTGIGNERKRDRTMDEAPKFLELNAIEENLLRAKLDAVRAAIAHAGEKGRALENGVRTLLRSILPAEYGLSTGFVVFHTPEGPRLSSQLDIIIYDAIRSGPVISLETCDVLPLEAVYGYVEVKATLRSSSDEAEKPAENSIEKCLIRNQELRNMRDRRYHLPIGTVETMLMPTEWASQIPSIRSYVFAFEASDAITQDPKRLAQRMADYSKKLGNPTHLHGLFIVGHGFLSTRPVDQARAIPADYFHTGYTEDHPLLAFKTSLIHALARFPRPHLDWAPAIEQYFPQSKWTFLKPQN
jgi:hypothetical protein